LFQYLANRSLTIDSLNFFDTMRVPARHTDAWLLCHSLFKAEAAAAIKFHYFLARFDLIEPHGGTGPLELQSKIAIRTELACYLSISALNI